jgi:hypothetical protein
VLKRPAVIYGEGKGVLVREFSDQREYEQVTKELALKGWELVEASQSLRPSPLGRGGVERVLATYLNRALVPPPDKMPE